MFVHSDRPHRSRNSRCCYQYCCGFIRWRRMSGGLIPLACDYDTTATQYNFPRRIENLLLRALWHALRLR